MEQKNSYIKKGRDRIEDLEGRTWYRELGTLSDLDILYDDHGLFVLTGQMDFGGTIQGIQFVVDNYNKGLKKRLGTATGMECIIRLIKLFEASSFDNIGGYVYALYEDNTHNGFIKGLMHPTKDKYVIFKDVVDDMIEHEWLTDADLD